MRNSGRGILPSSLGSVAAGPATGFPKASRMKKLEFFFDFISPYAYLASQRIEELASRHRLEVEWRPVLLAAMLHHNQQRGPAEIPDKRRYTFKHLSRLSHDLGIPLAMPPAHPFNPLLPLRILALRPEAGLVHHLFRACWKDGRAIDSAEALKDLMDADTLRQATKKEAKERLKALTQEAIERGIFGVPTMAIGEELFWGLDSFAHLERYLEGKDPVDSKLAERWESLPASATRQA